MSQEHINGETLYSYIIAGANELIEHENELNDLNVFPVPDADTGSNLAYTMKCIIARAEPNQHVGTTMSCIAQVALEDAYGNSGTIFASYLHGLSEQMKFKESLTVAEFSHMTKQAVTYAYESLAKPVEGTILTVMRAWGDYMADHHAKHGSLKTLFDHAMAHAESALQHTKEQLIDLKRAGVVDAGALGFVVFLDGIRNWMTGKKSVRMHEKAAQFAVDHDTMPQERYCSEYLLESQHTLNKKALMNDLEADNSSTVVQKTGGFYKIHTHTNHPDRVMKKLTGLGHVIKTKIDDMHMQVNLQAGAKYATAIAIDSIGDYPQAHLSAKQVFTLPLQLILNGQAHTDRLTLKNDDLFNALSQPGVKVSSAQPGKDAIKKHLAFLLDTHKNLLVCCVSSQMSGMYQRVIDAASDLDASRIHVLDTHTNSAAQGLLMHDLTLLRDQGADFKTLVDYAESHKHAYKIFVHIPDLYYATQSGRVPKLVGKIATALKLKAIISITNLGKGTVTREKDLLQVIDKKINTSPPPHYALVYTGDLKDHQEKIQAIKDRLGCDPVFIEEASSIVSAFIGKGALGIAYKEDTL